MNSYDFTWSMQVEADSAEDAIKQIIGIMRDPENTATFFAVIAYGPGGKKLSDTRMDLECFWNPDYFSDDDRAFVIKEIDGGDQRTY